MKPAWAIFLGLVMLAALLPVPESGAGLPSGALDLIPSPKIIEIEAERFLLNQHGKALAVISTGKGGRTLALAAEAINERIEALGGEPLKIVTAHDSAAPADYRQVIRLEVLEQGGEGDLPAEVRQAMAVVAAKGEQGYAIRFGLGQEQGQERDEDAFLIGVGRQGVLHAASTFRLLIKREGAAIYATRAQIVDWPDFQHRGLPVWPLPASYHDFKRCVDWAAQYKFNRIYTHATAKKAPDGFNLPTAEERRYLRRINAYARERGIKINYALTWALLPDAPDPKQAKAQGGVSFNGHRYSWGDDRLLRKRAAQIAQFARETGADSLHLHCIDTIDEAWGRRGSLERARFGNDRAAADANVINIFTSEIRRLNPGIELQFVVYPYHVNFELSGNAHYKAWIKNLSAQIPDDVYLISAELNRDQADSWVAVTRQPLVHWINGDAFQWGRYFSTLPAFTGSAYHPGRERDIVVHMEPIGFFNGEVMQLVAAEYEWNVTASGSGYISEAKDGRGGVIGGNQHYRQETVSGGDLNSWGWYRGTAEPAATSGELLLKACRLEFGSAAAPHMAEFFRNNPVGRRAPSGYGATLQEVLPGKELEASLDQLGKADRTLQSLKAALIAAGDDMALRERIRTLLANTYRQSLVISGAAASYRARQSSMRGSGEEAGKEIEKGRQRLALIRREMESGGYWSEEARAWYAEGERRLSLAASGRRGDLMSRNLIGNPGFEGSAGRSGAGAKRSLPGWSSTGDLEPAENSHSGKQAAQLKLTKSDSFVLMEQPISVAPSCEAYVEFWLKKDGEFRVIPMLQYVSEGQGKKVEEVAVADFPFGSAIDEYRFYSGTVRLPAQVRQATFKIYADWFGFTPVRDKSLYLDDVVVSCAPGARP